MYCVLFASTTFATYNSFVVSVSYKFCNAANALFFVLDTVVLVADDSLTLFR